MKLLSVEELEERISAILKSPYSLGEETFSPVLRSSQNGHLAQEKGKVQMSPEETQFISIIAKITQVK